MRCVISRVSQAQVLVEDQVVGKIDRGILAYCGFLHGDGQAQLDWMHNKLTKLRIFPDEQGKMNESVLDIQGGLLLIPNFTLAGRTQKGTRPSFTDAAAPDLASPLFDQFIEKCSQTLFTQAGIFAAHMDITATHDGPITLVIDAPQL